MTQDSTKLPHTREDHYEGLASQLLEENARLKERVAELEQYHVNGRMNIDFNAVDESLQICRGEHDAHEPCEWETYVTEKSVTNRIVRTLQYTIEQVKEARDN